MTTERRLRRVSQRLVKLREELRLAEEELLHFAENSDDTRLRALVSETPLSDHEHREAQKTTDAAQRNREALQTQILALEAEQDLLLDRLAAERR